ncbi:hypothetical protein LOTGIDRAFT_153914 [Lottia gigantea]|uniref:Uncharacterized protein n=1 Tax=Lottia gigantea TaxID=225164 RepID=V4A8U9_LOTGI|nr:hypothetical protein LOTGIDRAFT_153914 [Lottia gigantea]ESO91470.1 hypothetical protein LOTGIDRAFT_153914 [Lottia gigantea]
MTPKNIQSADIFLQPLGDGTNSDEDSGDEDHSGDIDNLSRQKLLADVDVDIELLSGEAVTIRSDGNIPEDESIETVLEDGLTPGVSESDVTVDSNNSLNNRFCKSSFIPTAPCSTMAKTRHTQGIRLSKIVGRANT